MTSATDKQARAERLAEARRRRGFPDAQAAATYHGWNYSSYSQHERGERGLSRSLAKYAKAYRVPAAWLLYGEGQPGWSSEAVSSKAGSEPPLVIERSDLRAVLRFVLEGEQLQPDHARELADIVVEFLAKPPIEEVDLDPVKSFRIRFRLEGPKS